MSEHRPTATIQVDVFPEDSILLDDDSDGTTYTPRDVAREAWANIQGWVDNGYQPIITVTMPDGSSHDIDLSAERV